MITAIDFINGWKCKTHSILKTYISILYQLELFQLLVKIQLNVKLQKLLGLEFKKILITTHSTRLKLNGKRNLLFWIIVEVDVEDKC